MGQAPAFDLPEGLLDLKAALEMEWPARQDALRASGVPLNDEADDAAAASTADAAAVEAAADTEAAAAAAKPWGDDKDFDPDKAWKLIQNVRGDADKLKTERDDLATKVKEHEDASKSEAEKRDERAALAEKNAALATLEAARLRVALKKGLTETQAKRLIGDTEEALEADADELLESFKGDVQDTTRRPRERLRPGAVPSADTDEGLSPRELAAKVPQRY